MGSSIGLVSRLHGSFVKRAPSEWPSAAEMLSRRSSRSALPGDMPADVYLEIDLDVVLAAYVMTASPHNNVKGFLDYLTLMPNIEVQLLALCL